MGVGKSRTAIGYYVHHVCQGRFPINGAGKFEAMKTPTDLYIITTSKKRDDKEWFSDLILYNISSDPSKSFGNVNVTVDSWNNIVKYKEITNAFFILDEQRLVGSGAWVKAFLKIAKNNRWIILSATPGDTWTDYIPAFVANGFYKNRSEFLETHAVYNRYSKYPKIDKFVETGRLLKFRKQILVEMPYPRKTVRHEHYLISDYDKDLYKKVVEKRWNFWEELPIENISQLFYLIRKVSNSDVSRLVNLKKTIQKHPRLIVFYNFDYELDALREFAIDQEFTYAEWNGHKHQPVPDTDSWIYLVQYTAGAEAWNCITTDAIFFYSLNYSWRITEQAKGRIDRMNTKYIDLHYYFCRSTSSIDQAIMKALKTKKVFNEGRAAKQLGIPPDHEPEEYVSYG